MEASTVTPNPGKRSFNGAWPDNKNSRYSAVTTGAPGFTGANRLSKYRPTEDFPLVSCGQPVEVTVCDIDPRPCPPFQFFAHEYGLPRRGSGPRSQAD